MGADVWVDGLTADKLPGWRGDTLIIRAGLFGARSTGLLGVSNLRDPFCRTRNQFAQPHTKAFGEGRKRL